MKKWCVYLVQCKDGSLYTGVSNDVEKRMEKHKSGKGSKYVKAKGFSRLIGFKECEDKVSAFKMEWKIKQMNKMEKLEIFRDLD